MNKFCCWLTGGHRYLAKYMLCYANELKQRMELRNICIKCGKVTEATIPYEHIFRGLNRRADDGH